MPTSRCARRWRARLESRRRKLTTLQSDLLDTGGLLWMDDMERVVGRLQLLIDRVKTAAYGYAGFFDLQAGQGGDLDRLSSSTRRSSRRCASWTRPSPAWRRPSGRMRASRTRPGRGRPVDRQLNETFGRRDWTSSGADATAITSDKTQQEESPCHAFSMSSRRPTRALNQMVHRVPETGSGDFRIGSQVIVRESQAAVFFRDGKALDTFGPGRHTITTANIPLLIDVCSACRFSGQTPFTAEVYFVNMRDFIDMKWGTPEPITLRDTDLGLVRLRAFGRYSMAISDPQMFVTKIVGTQGLYRHQPDRGLPARHHRQPADRPAGRDQGRPVRSAGDVR